MKVVKQAERYVVLDDVLPPEQFRTWHRINVVKRNAAFARAAIAGFFLPESDDTPFWR